MVEQITKPYQLISDVAEISKKLEYALQYHAMIKVAINDESQVSATLLVKIDHGNKLVLIDSLIPESSNVSLKNATKLQFTTVVDGIDLHFSMDYRQTTALGKSLVHVLTFPENVKYFQQRNYQRIQVVDKRAIQVILRTELNIALTGHLVDISVGGFAAHIDYTTRVTPRIGDKLRECEMCFSPKESFVCPAVIRYVGRAHDRKMLRLGMEFTDLSGVQKRMLERIVAGIEAQI